MQEEKKRAPIYEMLARHAERREIAFHVPGHKQRVVWQDAGAAAFYEPLLTLDVTELADTDDLHHPEGPIAEAQRLAADCFGAEETRFLVGGSTAGNLAMILGITTPGDLLIVQRNVHRSIFHGMMLAGVRAVLLQPEIDPGSGLAVIPDVDRVREAVQLYPEARGVILCSPNYYGMSGDLRPFTKICHQAGIPLLVDEAHGPHFGLHPQFPRSALQTGADIVVQSTHKMLSAMTMGAMLHMQGPRVGREAVRQALRMVQSSSPSFPLLASLDLARRQVHEGGLAAFESALNCAAAVRACLPQTVYRTIEYSSDHGAYRIDQDPLKLVLYDTRGELSGFHIRNELAARGCAIEMADARYAVLALGIGTREQDADGLVRALKEMSELQRGKPEAAGPEHHQTPTRGQERAQRRESERVPAPVAVSRALPQTERVRLEDSAGRIAGEWVVPYPPGIPELYPGETVTEQTIERLQRWRRQDASVQGAEDSELTWIRVAVSAV